MPGVRIRTADHRRHIPLGVKLQACLLLLGFTEDEITAEGQIVWDHHPALGLRVIDETTGKLRPAPNDPRFIRPLRKAAHGTKTNGPGGEKRICSAGGDQHAIAHGVRLARAHDDFQARRDLLAPAQTVSVKPKRSKPMPFGRASGLKRTFSGKIVTRNQRGVRP